MIYGLNFGAPDVSQAQHRFRPERRVEGRTWRARAMLQGIAQTEQEIKQMIITADNGHRKMIVTFDEKTKLFGLYVYWPEEKPTHGEPKIRRLLVGQRDVWPKTLPEYY